MEPPARHYLCARCRTAVLICSHCDRGQRYCASHCAKLARTQSLQSAGQRYQSSLPGRLSHAARQRRYRERQTKVTHHSSPSIPLDDLLPTSPTLPVKRAQPPCHLPWHCHFCGQLQSQFLRHRFLQRRIRRTLRLSDRRESNHDPSP